MQTRPGALSRSRSNHRIDPPSSHRLLILFIASSLLCLPVLSSANNAVIDAVHCYIKTGKTTKAEELISRVPAGYSAEALYRDHETLIDLIRCYLDAGLHDMASDLVQNIEAPPAVGSRQTAGDTIILNVILNGENKGECYVILTDEGDFLMKQEDLKAAGFRDPTGIVADVDGQQYLSLKSMEGVQFILNEKTLTIEIIASPSLLPEKVIDFMPRRQPKVLFPKDNSAFLNYRFDYEIDESFSFRSFSFTNQLGLRIGDLLFLTDSLYRESSRESSFVRLMSSVTMDRRSSLERLVVGDFFASSGELGSDLTLGGISFSKAYQIDPYFIKEPMFNASGIVSLPSQAEVYLDGIRIRTERLSPGAFNLRNIRYYGGSRAVEVVIKDPFGREETMRYPFYFTDRVLRKGLHDFSYNIGFLRENLGVESNDYRDLAFSGFHRYGVSDALTAGLRGEGGDGRYNLGPQASLLIEKLGLLQVSLSASHDRDNGLGTAGVLRYNYQSEHLSLDMFIRGVTDTYAAVSETALQDRVRHEEGFTVSYWNNLIGSLSLDYSRATFRSGDPLQQTGITWSKTFARRWSLYVSYRNIRHDESSDRLFASLTYYPRVDTSVAASYERRDNRDIGKFQIQKNPPLGEGIGFRASVERDSAETTVNRIDASLQYNARRFIIAGEHLSEFNGETNGLNRLALSGGLAYVGGTLGFSRPVTDSFGLVKLGDLSGVRVSVNGQEIGKTDKSGKLFLPDLSSYYDNQIRIADKDIPIEYAISQVEQYVSPPLRSGSIITFDVAKFQAFTGVLMIQVDGDVKVVDFHEFTMIVEGKELLVPTGTGGEFYFENVKPGNYQASLKYKEKTCSFGIIVPSSVEMTVDLGGILCEDTR